MVKPLTVWIAQQLWKILKEMGIPDHLTRLLINQYAGQEAAVRMGHRTTDWFQTGKGLHQGCILSLWLFNFYAEYIMRNSGLDEAQAVIKIAGRNINNLRCTDNTTFMEEIKKVLKRLFSSSSLSAIRVVSSTYLRLLIFLPAILIPACVSSSPAFLMMYSA